MKNGTKKTTKKDSAGKIAVRVLCLALAILLGLVTILAALNVF